MKLIVLIAFDENDDGELTAAFEAREMRSADQALREARVLAVQHAGVIVWQRDAQPDIGEYGEPEVLFQHGLVPDLS